MSHTVTHPRFYIKLFVILAVMLADFVASGRLQAGPTQQEALSETKALFQPTFTILYRSDNPEIAFRPAGIPRNPYNVPTWKVDPSRASNVVVKRDASQGGDGFDDRILGGSTDSRTFNLFDAGDLSRITAALPGKTDPVSPGVVNYRFPDNNPFVRLSATLAVSHGNHFPVFTVTVTRKQDGWISIGYTGAPEVADADAEEVWQPLIWTERRFPSLPYLTSAHMCPLPASFVRHNGSLYGIIADPGELPFQPLPTFDNSRFGVAVRTAQKTLSPMLFFPMLGGKDSYGKAGETLTFKFRLVNLPDTDVVTGFEKIARELYAFADRRHNALGRLNTALTGIVDYGMSKYSYWDAALRGCGYSTDVPDAVKNVSSLNPLELAFVTGRQELFDERARPIMEYLFSREKFLFSLDPEQKIQSPSRALLGPCAPVSEFAALHDISHGNTDVFIETARELFPKDRIINLDEPSPGPTWWNALALYRSTGEKHWLDKAVKGADEYLAKRVDVPATKFEDPDSQGFFFWPGFVPRWIDLLMLYEASGEQRYLDAAHKGARLNALFIWMCPVVPNENIHVNDGGKAPVYWYLGGRGFPAIPVPEEEAPAWRLSELGLTPESSGTATGHRAIFMAHHAPWMLRLAALTQDKFLHDIARWAVIGRYRSFPGYHINTARTTVYEKADYAFNPHEKMSYNSIHYNHIWPMASMVLDYLVTDAWARSNGQVEFPDQYIEGYAYLQSRFYGHRPGKIYDLENMTLWLPDGLVNGGSEELNYVAAYNEKGVAIVFTNQSFARLKTQVTLDVSKFVSLPDKARVRQWVSNKAVADTTWGSKNGVSVNVAASGITAIFIEGAKPKLGWTPGRDLATPASSGVVKLSPADTRAMVLSFGDLSTWLYAYAREDDSKWKDMTLSIKDSSGTTVLKDNAFPFEFTKDLTPQDISPVLKLDAHRRDGSSVEGAPVKMGK